MNLTQKFSGFQPKKPFSDIEAKTVEQWKVNEELIGFWQEDKQYESKTYGGTVTYHYLVKASIDKKGSITTDDEVVCLRSGAGLGNQLKDLQPGQLVKLTYLGKQKNPKTGMSFHKFSSEVASNFYVLKDSEKKVTQNDDIELSWDD